MLSTIDWTVVILYLCGLIALSILLSRQQSNIEDYFVASNTGGHGGEFVVCILHCSVGHGYMSAPPSPISRCDSWSTRFRGICGRWRSSVAAV